MSEAWRSEGTRESFRTRQRTPSLLTLQNLKTASKRPKITSVCTVLVGPRILGYWDTGILVQDWKNVVSQRPRRETSLTARHAGRSDPSSHLTNFIRLCTVQCALWSTSRHLDIPRSIPEVPDIESTWTINPGFQPSPSHHQTSPPPDLALPSPSRTWQNRMIYCTVL
jgi:hypothetical protein